MIKRRQFMGILSGSALGLLLPGRVHAQDGETVGSLAAPVVPGPTGAVGRVVVVGGGMAGATVAKFLRLWGGSEVQVTLVERNSNYPSSILSNLVLNGSTTMNQITFNFNALAQNYGVNVVRGEVGMIDKAAKMVTVGNATLPYDRLILAPGIELDYSSLPGLAGLPPSQLPLHAWIGGPQTTALRNQLVAMPRGQNVIITVPPAPFRCPPGPYERACVIADWLRRNRRGGRVIVLDANPAIVAEAETFNEAFTQIHAGFIEYHPGVVITNINPVARTVTTQSHGTFAAGVLNVIPPQRAGKVVTDAGLVPPGGTRAPVNVLTYESTMAPAIHVLGDSALAPLQPMAGHLANQEAKVCADAIVRMLSGRAVDPAPLTNSACFSPITQGTASWLSVVFTYNPGTGRMEPVPASVAEARDIKSDHYEKMFKWFGNLMADSFG